MREDSPSDLEAVGLDGTRLIGRLWTGSGTPRSAVVIVHGLKDHSGRYGEVADELTGRGIAVAAFDLRGHGRSEGERAWTRRFEDFGTDLDAEIQVVRERLGEIRPILFGHSLGGAIAARYALDHSDRLQGLVLSAPALRPPANAPPGAAGFVRLLSAIAPHARVFRPNVAGFSRIPAVVQGILSDPMVDPKPVPARTAAELLRTMASVRRDSPRLRLPVLAFHGTGDAVTSAGATKEFVDGLGSPDRRLRTVPGAYHDLWHEPEAAALRREFADWVSQRPVGTAGSG
jgi:acylglycerol lipase